SRARNSSRTRKTKRAPPVNPEPVRATECEAVRDRRAIVALGCGRLGRERGNGEQGLERVPRGFVPARIVGIGGWDGSLPPSRDCCSRSRLRCSFCGRTADEVERLVAGPSVYICDGCIKTCVAVVEQHGGFPPSRPAEQDGLSHA